MQHQGDDLEIIAINDGSTDESGTVLEVFSGQSPMLKVISLPVNQGVSAARNAGLDAARGSYVLFVDADDRLCQGAVPCLLEGAAKGQPDITLFQHRKIADGGHVVQEAPAVMERMFNLSRKSDRREAFDSVVGNLMAWNGFYKRVALGDLRFKQFPNGEDVLFGAEAFCRASSILIQPHTLYEYVQHVGSASRAKTKRHCLSAIEVACALYASLRESEYYGEVKDLLFRKLRAMSFGLALNVLHAVPAEERAACWAFWFDRMGPLFCLTDLVPSSQRWIHRAVFRMRSRTGVWLVFELPLALKARILSVAPIKALWLKIRIRMRGQVK